MLRMKKRNCRPTRNARRQGFQPRIEILEDRLAPCCSIPLPEATVEVPDFYSTPANTPVSGDVTANDLRLVGGAYPHVVTPPVNGQLAWSYSDASWPGSFTYTPNPGFSGADTFTYVTLESSFSPFLCPVCVHVSNPATVTIAVGIDSVPTLEPRSLWISDASVIEGDSGTTDAEFIVTMSEPSPLPVTVNYEAWDSCYRVNCASDEGAEGNYDYAVTSGTLTFMPGETSQTIAVSVFGDTEIEPDEYFYVELSNAVNATVEPLSGQSDNDGFALGKIINDDAPAEPPPSLAISDVNKKEGNSGGTAFVFTVTLSHASSQTVRVQYWTSDGTATAGTDYTSVYGTLTFVPGDTSEGITVWVNGDTVKESSEAFYVDLYGPTNAVIADGHAVASILNDDHKQSD